MRKDIYMKKEIDGDIIDLDNIITKEPYAEYFKLDDEWTKVSPNNFNLLPVTPSLTSKIFRKPSKWRAEMLAKNRCDHYEPGRDDIRKIKSYLIHKVSDEDIIAIFGISQKRLQQIKNPRLAKKDADQGYDDDVNIIVNPHKDNDLEQRTPKKHKKPKKLLCEDEVIEIRRLYKNCINKKRTTIEIAIKYGVSPKVAKRIVENKTYKHLILPE